jgi:hypothetical protein
VTANLLAQEGSEGEALSPVQVADAREFGRMMAAQPHGMLRGAGGMHRTDTIDIGVVVSGEVTVESEDGSRVTMGPGDVYIQNGAIHAWRTNPDNPALVVYVLVGAGRSDAAATAAADATADGRRA